MSAVTQEWTHKLSMMQQSVLLTSVRGPDGIPKYSSVKYIIRWFRRCVLISALDNVVFTDPVSEGGGSFTGPVPIPSGHTKQFALDEWELIMNSIVSEFLKEADGIPHHFQMHLMHAAEIVGYKHTDERIARWWQHFYNRFVSALHLHPESEEEMDSRLGDNKAGWLKRADPATAL
jgi:hypothetical protein